MRELNQGARQLRNDCQEFLDLAREALARTKTSVALGEQVLACKRRRRPAIVGGSLTETILSDVKRPVLKQVCKGNEAVLANLRLISPLAKNY